VVVVGAVVVVVGWLVVVVDEPGDDVVVAVPMSVVVGAVVVVVVVVAAAVVVVVEVGGRVGPGAPLGEGNAGSTMTGLVVVGAEVVVVAGTVVDVVDVVTPAEPAAGLGLEVVAPPAPPTVRTTLRVNDEVLLRARRAKATLLSLPPPSLPMRTRAEYLPVAHRLGLCEYTTTKDGWETSLSWHQTACRTVPVTSTAPPEAPSLLGLTCADTTAACAGRVAAVLVATRPNMAQASVASTAASTFMAPSPQPWGRHTSPVGHAELCFADRPTSVDDYGRLGPVGKQPRGCDQTASAS
jgi:hypothetical protein